jgi:hypothetical protein
MSLKFLKKSPMFWLYAGGAVLLVAAAFVWCFVVNKSPEKVFWNTIENGLTSHGVTVQSEQTNASVGNKQTIRFSFGAENLSHSITTLTQPGTTVVNEMLGTTEARGKLIKQIRDDMVYQIDFAKVKKERSHGRLLYTYDATLEPVAYVGMMKLFSSSVGLHGLDQLNPENYRGQKSFNLQITIDVRSRQVTQITAAENNSKQTYSGYGIPVQIDPPKNIISGTELQKRLQDLQ